MSLSQFAFAPLPSTAVAPPERTSADGAVTPRFALQSVLGESGPGVQIGFASWSNRGIWIECRRRIGDWEFVAITTETSYGDGRGLLKPQHLEIREYRVRYFDWATPSAPWSPVQKIVVEPALPTP